MNLLRKIIILITLLTAAVAPAAVVEYSPKGIVSFTESTPWGDIVIVFRRCMNNNLFTFSSVVLNGVQVNNGNISDNIGPFNIENCGWIGGNHLDAKGRPTAATAEVELLVDDAPVDMKKDLTAECKLLTVNVHNIITIDKTQFIHERITYRVAGNSIDVEATHDFMIDSPVKVITYYGMQSMMKNEVDLLLPGTDYNEWIPKPGSLSISKLDAPVFKIFLERSGLACQATLLYSDDLGSHELVQDDKEIFIFSRNVSKSYHVLMRNAIVDNTVTTRWHGMYSWFDAPVEDTFATCEENPSITFGIYLDAAPMLMTVDKDAKITARRYRRPVVTATDNHIHRFDGGIMIDDNVKIDTVISDLSGKFQRAVPGIHRLAPGLYIIRSGPTSRKMVVK